MFKTVTKMQSRSAQRGGVLVVSLILLIIISLFTINSMTNALLQLKMAQNLSSVLENDFLQTGSETE